MLGARRTRALLALLSTYYAPAFVVSTILGSICVRAILREAHGPAAPLDDTFIHLQFARGLAQGRFFEYVAGEGYVSGATSLLWPLLLAPFHALGLRDVSLLWAAWALGTAAHAGTAVEAYRLARRLGGDAAALGAGAMCSLFGAFAWFAWSGMETMALAWILLRAARASAESWEPERGKDPPSLRELVAIGLAAPLIGPEGAIASLVTAAALLQRLPRGRAPWALLPLAGPLVSPLLNLIFSGHATSATAQVKWLVGNPYYRPADVLAASVANARFLVTSLMDGGDFTFLFLPEGASVAILLGAIALPIAAVRRRVPAHAAFTAVVALGSFLPCTYGTFLWNRIRYVWPFAGAWFVLVACLTREAGDLVRIFRPRLRAVTPFLAGAFAASLAFRLPWAIDDLAQSAGAVTQQQVALGRWASVSLSPEARLGVNDTGALAYVSGRRTFDVVGLTTEGEARYWVAGAGSRFEHYERLPAARRPTHFVVYPQWMACPPVLGRVLTEATVTDQSILGGTTMVAYEARWDLLGSGALPASPPPGATLVDEVDVADLESEAAHGYALDDGRDADDQVKVEDAIADGGRLRRAVDRFHVEVPRGARAALWMRVSAESPVDLLVSAGGHALDAVAIERESEWVEASVPLPAEDGAGAVPITVAAKARDGARDPRFGSFHYWVYADQP